jgi:uncharacterized protein GlcG (DUF336 family)
MKRIGIWLITATLRLRLADLALAQRIKLIADVDQPTAKNLRGTSGTGFKFATGAVLFAMTLFSPSVVAQDLPAHDQLREALRTVVAEDNGGLGTEMWATVVDRDGVVQVLVFSGEERGDQWPGSRAISAEKANTANAFSLPQLASSTANLYWPTQPGGTLFGLALSNPADPDVLYDGPLADIGTVNDPMVGQQPGGIIVFGGGLPLYSSDGTLLGGLGVSGNTSCSDHIIAWKLRHALNLDNVPAGVTEASNDNIIFDIQDDGVSESGWGHPVCTPEATEIARQLPETHPTGSEP